MPSYRLIVFARCFFFSAFINNITTYLQATYISLRIYVINQTLKT